jgi:hypothetical protein
MQMPDFAEVFHDELAEGELAWITPPNNSSELHPYEINDLPLRATYLNTLMESLVDSLADTVTSRMSELDRSWKENVQMIDKLFLIAFDDLKSRLNHGFFDNLTVLIHDRVVARSRIQQQGYETSRI